jgi:CheY-like chemotaxis protein
MSLPAEPLVLLVEDSALVVEALSVLLEATGYRVVGADSVAAAVRTARRERPAVLLLDLTLPDGHGLEVLTALQGDADGAPPTVALTGHDDPDTIARCLRAGCRAVLAKPVPARTLLDTLAGVRAAA